MHRLFVALRPPPPVRAALLGIAHAIPGARWQDDEQFHLTLRFVGAVDRPQAEDIAAALAQVRAPDPVVRLAGVGRFDRRGRTESIWAGVAPHDALAHLHRKVNQACARAGVPPEGRAYLPHITLARFSRTTGGAPEIDGWLAQQAGLGGEPFGFGHLALYESHLGSEGARYEVVARWPLD